MLQKDSQGHVTEASALDSHNPAFLAVWLLACLWSGRYRLSQGSAHLSCAIGIAVLT